MVLMMARPTKRKGTANIQYQRRIPADVARILDGLPSSYRPSGWGKTQITISTGTSDKRRGQSEYARIAREVEERFQSLRQGQRTLSTKEAVALSGLIYRAFAETLEENPGSPSRWEKVLQDNATAKAGRYGLGPLLIGSKAQREASMESRFGPFVDAVLAKEGLILCQASRSKVLEQFASALDQAALKLKKNASGDYRPDADADRFSTWTGLVSPGNQGRLKLSELYQKWEQHPEQKNQSQATLRRYRGVFGEVQEFLKNPAIDSITKNDLIRYTEAMMAEGELSAKTVRNVHKAALSSVFNWAVGKGLVAHNPAQEVKIKVTASPRNRPKELSNDEALALADACLQVTASAQSGSTEAACRWCPLICLYTGARIGEVTQLRKEDFRNQGGIWFIRITPDAGTVKDKEYRDIPVHSRLVELGLLDFVNRAQGPLFFDPDRPRKRNGKTPIRELVAREVGEWAREHALTDPLLLKPLHAIRHRFTTVARRVGIAEEFAQALTGHASGQQNRKYGSYEISVLARELAKLTVEIVEGRAP